MATFGENIEAFPLFDFVPAWSRSNVPVPGENVNGKSIRVDKSVLTREPVHNSDHTLSNPVFAKNRYGREDLIGLIPKDTRVSGELELCLFYSPTDQQPIVLQQYSEVENRLQYNINSNKAMNNFSQLDRSINGGSFPNPQQHQQGNTAHTIASQNFVSNWNCGVGNGVGRGGAQLNRAFPYRGRGGVHHTGSNLLGGGTDSSVSTRSRGRGGAACGRGGGMAGSLTITSRTQGLYDLRSPNDRPRKLNSSVSEDTLSSAPENREANSASVASGGNFQVSAHLNEDWKNAAHRCESWKTRSTKTSDQNSSCLNKTSLLQSDWKCADHDGHRLAESRNVGVDVVVPAPPVDYDAWTNPDDDSEFRSAKDSKLTEITNDRKLSPEPRKSKITDVVPRSEELWFYIDPKSRLQGPFLPEQMQKWFNSGYFSKELRVRYCGQSDNRFITLGELICCNGSTETFRPYAFNPNGKESSSIVPVQEPQSFDQNIWSEGTLVDKVEEERKRLAEKEKRLQEQEEAMAKREAERMMKWEVEMHEKELILQKKQEEMFRFVTEKEEKQAHREKELEMERRRLAEEIVRNGKEEVEKLLEKARLEAEEMMRQKLAMEFEQQKLALELEQQKLVEEKMTCAESGEWKAVIKTEKKAVRKMEKKARSGENSERKQEHICAAGRPTMPEKSHSKSVVEQQSKGDAQQIREVVNSKPVTSKVAPWSKLDIGDMRSSGEEKSLLEIQREEEMRSVAEAKKKELLFENNREDQANPVNNVWASASEKLVWDWQSGLKSVFPNALKAKLNKDICNNAERMALNSQLEFCDPLESNRLGSSKTKKEDASCNDRGDERKENINESDCPLYAWIFERVRQINAFVDADFLATVMPSVEDPEEVKACFETYLGDGADTRNFLREFFERRSQVRSKKQCYDKDDLSCPALAANASQASSQVTANSASQVAGTSVSRKKKKNNRGNMKVYVDSHCLGFKGTSDPNRVNVGEIDTIAPTHFDRSRR